MNNHTQSVFQRGVVVAFAAMVAALTGTVIASFSSAPTAANLVGIKSAAVSSAMQVNTVVPPTQLTDADPNAVVVTVTDELGNEVINYTQAELDEVLLEANGNGASVADETNAGMPDGTQPISTATCQDQTAKIGKIFTASAGPKGSKTYSYCTEATLKQVLGEHMDKAAALFCSNFNANKYTPECKDGCQQVSGVKGASGTFKEKNRTFAIGQMEDKSCKTTTGNSTAYTGSATLQGDCTFVRMCEPFKSKFNQY